ncbi:MAG: Brp/Blh family beta-carotene 15,15'-dioxygenase [Flavobacteriales bacterium]|nr:Brp/Blh family beta-carotene 15,15'-dioxygenase [Flavobacteriales bacterium]
MNRFTFIFVVCIYALFLIYQAFVEIPLNNQLIGASVLILLFGIPHGAIDHVLFFRKRKMSQFKFYAIYLGLIVAFVLLWFWQPVVSFVIFLLLSAFHFGESQLVDIKLSQKWRPILFFSWGLALLASLVYYNINELAGITALFQDTQGFSVVYNEGMFFWFYAITNALTVLALDYLFLSDNISFKRFSSEIFVIVLVHLTFYLFPFIIGFTLYFVILHSIMVMNQEYQFFKSERTDFSVMDFMKLLLPYSSLSIIFTTALVLLSYNGTINISVPFLALIIISVITLPHAIVMNIFYNK